MSLDWLISILQSPIAYGSVLVLVALLLGRRLMDYKLESIQLLGLSFKESVRKKAKTPDVRNMNVIDQLSEFNPKKMIKKYFPSYKEYFVLQYGSSVRENGVSFRDKDFIILLVGSPSEKEKIILHEGHTPSLDKPDRDNIDIVVRDYNSFTFSLIAGMPYEHSVVRWCEVKQGHLGYINWLKRMAKNILIDRDYLIKQIETRISRQKDLWSNLGADSDVYDLSREGYFLISYYVQLKWARCQKKVLRHNQVSDIALAKNMITFIRDEEVREKYGLIISYVKRYSVPVSKAEVKNIVNKICIDLS